MIALAAALAAGAGAYLLATVFIPGFGRSGSGVRRQPKRLLVGRARDWLAQAGLADVRPLEFAGVAVFLLVVGTAGAFALLGAPVPALIIGAAVATTPVQIHRARRASRMQTAQEAWPRLIDEIRVRATTLGRSLPQAVIEVGERAPRPLRPAFAAAQREWLLTLDFARMLDVLKDRLADPTADSACETLLVAHEVGGADLAPRLAALSEDRQAEATARKEARARQAGVRLARRFVLVVPAGMAAAGSLIGDGRAAYATGTGQIAVVVALAMVGGCWLWAGRYLRLPIGERVFRTSTQDRQTQMEVAA